MKVSITLLKRLPRSLKYARNGVVVLPCEVVETAETNKNLRKFEVRVRLLEQGAGYKAGHILLVGLSQLSEG